jgi:hypothetical protein
MLSKKAASLTTCTLRSGSFWRNLTARQPSGEGLLPGEAVPLW